VSRRRFAVALLAPAELAATLDAFRLAVGSRRPPNIAPHITLVPPVNLGDDEIAEMRAIVRAAAEATQPFEVSVGPTASFSPRTPTVHLAVEAAPAIDALRVRLRTGVLHRPDPHGAFTPHLTLDASSDPATIDAALLAMAGYRGSWTATAVNLLEHVDDDVIERRRWKAVAEEPLGPPVVVGRGGVEVRLRVLNMVPAVAAQLTSTAVVEPSTDPGRPRPLVVIADAGTGGGDRRIDQQAVDQQGIDPQGIAGAAVGAMFGSVAQLEAVVVDERSRGLGIGPHLVHQWCSSVAAAGSELVLVDLRAGNRWPGEFAFLDRLGFTGTAGYMLRRL